MEGQSAIGKWQRASFCLLCFKMQIWGSKIKVPATAGCDQSLSWLPGTRWIFLQWMLRRIDAASAAVILNEKSPRMYSSSSCFTFLLMFSTKALFISWMLLKGLFVKLSTRSWPKWVSEVNQIILASPYGLNSPEEDDLPFGYSFSWVAFSKSEQLIC